MLAVNMHSPVGVCKSDLSRRQVIPLCLLQGTAIWSVLVLRFEVPCKKPKGQRNETKVRGRRAHLRKDVQQPATCRLR